MIPLVWLLLAWIVCVGVFLILALMTTILALRFGLSGSRVVLFCGGFLAVAVIVIGTVGTYALTQVDWSSSLSITPSISTSDYFLP